VLADSVMVVQPVDYIGKLAGPTPASIRRLILPHVGLHLGHRNNIGVFHRHVLKIGKMRALVFVRYAFFRNDGAEAAGQAVDDGGAHAAGCGPARDDDSVDLVEGKQRTEIGFKEGCPWLMTMA
jgi:hypothetical protein